MSEGTRTIVCIVDDVEAVRKSIGAVLETADLAVRDYGSAGEFLAQFVPDSTGCLIVDQHMPDMTGLELLRLLRARGIAIPVIVITGHGGDSLRERVMQAGAVTMLDKPVDGDDLITIIERIMAKNS